MSEGHGCLLNAGSRAASPARGRPAGVRRRMQGAPRRATRCGESGCSPVRAFLDARHGPSARFSSWQKHRLRGPPDGRPWPPRA
ncbi:hypothetical protein D516_2373 [Rhodobacter sp. AKP1]|nr:hypothetical protein D516_2373 [Rhodobacter sp. AKP1]